MAFPLHVHVERKLEYEPIAWCIAHCPFCNQFSPTTKDKVFDVAEPGLWRIFRGYVFRCDFCQRSINADKDIDCLPLEDWSPKEGILALLRRLKLPLYAPIEFNAPARLHSLLGAAKSCYPKRKIWDWKGLTLGGMIGFLIAGAVACGLNLFALIPSNYEGTEIPMAALFLTGSAIGSIIVYFMERRKAAAKLIVRAFQRYGIDLDELCAMADDYPQWVQRVAKDVRMKCLGR